MRAYEKEAENGKKRRYYSITPAGERQLRAEMEQWESFRCSVERVIRGGAHAFS